MPADPVHHVEVCVADIDVALHRFATYGFHLYAKRDVPNIFKQYVIKLGKAQIFFILTERLSEISSYTADPNEVPVFFCCSNHRHHQNDSVFNVCLNINKVEELTSKIESECAQSILYPPSVLRTENGTIRLATIKSIVGNLQHTLINVADYKGDFLPGFTKVCETEQFITDVSITTEISRIDHVTLASNCGDSKDALKFYQKCFGMQEFSISEEDVANEGLILSDGIGLRLRAMEFYRCSEKFLVFDPSFDRDRKRNPNALLFVVVESLPGQRNCNVEAFLQAHGPGVEHIAFFSRKIKQDVATLQKNGVQFRKPPDAYYTEIEKNPGIQSLKELPDFRKLGILIDLEPAPLAPNDGSEQNDEQNKKRFIMQIFAHPIFAKNTFFIEIIHRVHEARGLGSRNIIALVRSIRQDKSLLQDTGSEALSSPRRIC